VQRTGGVEHRRLARIALDRDPGARRAGAVERP
jgi:hypothetical protein